MDLLLRLVAMHPVPLLLVSLAWTLVDVGQFAVAATPRNFREIFVGRCEEYQRATFAHWIDTYVISTVWLKKVSYILW